MSRIDTRMVLDGGQETMASLAAMARAISSGDIVTKAGKSLERESLRIAAALTPRQKHRREPPTSRRGGRPLYKDWRAITLASVKGNVYQSVVFNEASQTPEGRIIMLSLEYGAKPHVMDPPNTPFYQWITTGYRTVFLGRTTDDAGRTLDRVLSKPLLRKPGDMVRWMGTGKTGKLHPGVRKPFGMVSRTRAQMDPIAAQIGRVVVENLGRSWGGSGTVTLSGFGL